MSGVAVLGAILHCEAFNSRNQRKSKALWCYFKQMTPYAEPPNARFWGFSAVFSENLTMAMPETIPEPSLGYTAFGFFRTLACLSGCRELSDTVL